MLLFPSIWLSQHFYFIWNWYYSKSYHHERNESSCQVIILCLSEVCLLSQGHSGQLEWATGSYRGLGTIIRRNPVQIKIWLDFTSSDFSPKVKSHSSILLYQPSDSSGYRLSQSPSLGIKWTHLAHWTDHQMPTPPRKAAVWTIGRSECPSTSTDSLLSKDCQTCNKSVFSHQKHHNSFNIEPTSF